MELYKKCKICGKGIAMDEAKTGNGFNIESRNAAGETYYLSLNIRERLYQPDASDDWKLRNQGFAHYDCIMDAIVEFRELAKKIGGV